MELGFFNRHALRLIASRKNQNWFSRSDICQLVTNIRQMMTANCSHLNFDNPAFLTSEDYFTLTGLNKEQFQDLASSLSSLQNSKVRSIRTYLSQVFERHWWMILCPYILALNIFPTMSSAEVKRLRPLQSCLGLTLVMPLQSSISPTYISRRARIIVSKEDHIACTRIGLC